MRHVAVTVCLQPTALRIGGHEVERTNVVLTGALALQGCAFAGGVTG